ncbi:MAG: hypothetical protein U0165_10580 [Polyangiaceae bacterium]
MSAYFDVPEGPFDLGIVPASQASCDSPYLELTSISFAANSLHTLTLTGNPIAEPSTANAKLLTDDRPDTSVARFRFVNTVSASTELDIGYYAGLSQSPQAFTNWTRFISRADGMSSVGVTGSDTFPVDENGYASSQAPFPGGISYEVRYSASGSRIVTVENIPPDGVSMGERATLFLFGLDNSPEVVAFLWCNDTAAPVGGLSQCEILPFADGYKPPNPGAYIAPFSAVRFAHLSTDTSETLVDICAKPVSYPTWKQEGPQLLKTGLKFGDITGDIGLSIDSEGLDIKVIPANSPMGCEATAYSAHQISTGALTESTNFTLAMTGIAGDANFPFALRTYDNVDQSSSGSKVRFIHVAPKIGNAASTYGVDLSKIDQTGVGLLVPASFPSVPFGGVSPDATTSSGYLDATFLASDVPGLNTDGNQYSAEHRFQQFGPDLATSGNNTYTYWLAGELGNTTLPPVLIVCKDSESHTMSVLSCTQLAMQ